MANRFTRLFKIGNIVTFLVLFGIIYGIYYSVTNKKSTTVSVTLSGSVRLGDIEDSIDVIGTSKLINAQKIRFNQLGKVNVIHFKEGDSVKKGQIIAELDKTDLLNSLKQAEINLNNSKIILAEDLKPLEEKDVLKSENDVSKANNDLGTSKDSLTNLQTEKDNKINDLNNQIKAKELDIKNKSANLTLAESNLDLISKQEGKNISNTDIDLQKTIDTAATDARKFAINANNIINAVDALFGFTDNYKYKVSGYDIYISAKDLSFKNDTSNYFSISKGKVDDLNEKLKNLLESGNKIEDVSAVFDELSVTYNNLVLLGKSAASAINASMSASSFSQSQIDSGYSSMNSQYNQAQSNFDAIKTTLTNLQKLSDPELQKLQSNNTIAKQVSSINDQKIAINTANNDIISLKNNLELTIKNYDVQIIQKQNDITNQENIIKLNKANFDFLLKGTSKEQIARDKNDITKQELSLEAAKKSLDKYQIEAPFDGVLRQIDFKAGDNLIADDTKFVYIDNPNLLEITVQLDQTQVAKVKMNQKAKMIFDSFPKQTFDGIVTLINPTPIQTSGVTSYEIKLTMDKKDFAIYSGMTAKISIIIDSRIGVVTVPTSFVQKRRGASFVTIPSKTSTGELIEIKTGLSNPRVTEVAEGLSEGDIVLRTVTISASGSTQTSLFSGPGGGGGRNGGGGGGGNNQGGGGNGGGGAPRGN